MVTNFKNKRILITAGPTWVPIDSVRIISNTATGKTGILLAEKLTRLGARVNLLLGPGTSACKNKAVNITPFKFFDELNSLIKKELKSKRYDVIIQSAAISDYKPSGIKLKKISSMHKDLKLSLVPTPKIIDTLRNLNPDAYLIGFKFEPDLSGRKLVNKANRLLKRSRLDLVVANTFKDNYYNAYLVTKDKVSGLLTTKEKMCSALLKSIKQRFN